MSYILKLTNTDKVAIIDHEDAQMCEQYKWHLDRCGYPRTTRNKKQFNLHRFIKNVHLGGDVVDHKNGNKLDNRKENLRFCIQRLNTCNRPKQFNNKTGYKGVATAKSPFRFRAIIMVMKKQIYLGTYDSPEEAAKVYDEAARIYFGEFAYLNFPNKDNVA